LPLCGRYAAYEVEDGEVMGDPANLGFTTMLEEKFGWKGPKTGRTNYDFLPLVYQVCALHAPSRLPSSHLTNLSPSLTSLTPL